jgi:hypothetical protein
MIIIRDNAVWWRRPNGAETQATPEQCAAEIAQLRAERAWQPIETAPKDAAPRPAGGEVMDIVERLRQPVMLHSNPEQTNAERREAADEIEQLRAALAPLAALKLWRDTYPDAIIDTIVDRRLEFYFTPDQVRRARELTADREDK